MSQSAHAGANSQASRNFRLKPNLFTAHLLAQPNYGDNTCPPDFDNDNSKTISPSPPSNAN